MPRSLRALCTLGVIAIVPLLPACRRPAPPDASSPAPSTTGRTVTPGTAPAAARGAQAAALDGAPSSDGGVELRPSPEPDRRAREHAVLALLSEGVAESLPEVASEPNTPLDDGLRERLAPMGPGTAPRGVAVLTNIQAPESIENAARVIAGMRAAFRACYSRSLHSNPVAHGVVRVRAQVAAGGEVTSAKATPNTKLPPALIPCVEGRVRGAQFAATKDAKPAELGFHVNFYVEE